MLSNSKRHIGRRGEEVNMIKFTVHLRSMSTEHKSTIVLL